MGAHAETINAFGLRAWEILWPSAWQGSLLVVAVLLLTALARRFPACVKHGLWLIVLLKLALPMPVALPTEPLSPYQFVPQPSGGPVETGNLILTAISITPFETPFEPEFATEPSLPVSTPRVHISPVATMAFVWLSIAAAILVFRVIRYRRVRRLMLRLAEPASPELEAMADQIRGTIGLKRPVRLLQIEDIASPLVLGFLRPLVLMPAPEVSGLSPGETRALLAHELQHLRRRDHWVLPLELFALALHWFNPLAWLTISRLRAERERATDDAVVSMQGDIEADYGSGLLKLARMAMGNRATGAGALALFESRGDLARRIKRMMATRRVTPKIGRLALVSILALACVVLAKGPDENAQTSVVIPDGKIFDIVGFVKADAAVNQTAGTIGKASAQQLQGEESSKRAIKDIENLLDEATKQGGEIYALRNYCTVTTNFEKLLTHYYDKDFDAVLSQEPDLKLNAEALLQETTQTRDKFPVSLDDVRKQISDAPSFLAGQEKVVARTGNIFSAILVTINLDANLAVYSVSAEKGKFLIQAESYLRGTPKIGGIAQILYNGSSFSDFRKPSIHFLAEFVEACPAGIVIDQLELRENGDLTIRGVSPTVNGIIHFRSALTETSKRMQEQDTANRDEALPVTIIANRPVLDPRFAALVHSFEMLMTTNSVFGPAHAFPAALVAMNADHIGSLPGGHELLLKGHARIEFKDGTKGAAGRIVLDYDAQTATLTEKPIVYQNQDDQVLKTAGDTVVIQVDSAGKLGIHVSTLPPSEGVHYPRPRVEATSRSVLTPISVHLPKIKSDQQNR